MKKAALIVVAALFLVGWTGLLARAQNPVVSPDCPCYASIDRLIKTYQSNPEFKTLLDSAFKNVQQLPSTYPDGNPWLGKDIFYMAGQLEKWCTFLPSIRGSHDDGLKYIQEFAFFYYKNPYGISFVQLPPGRDILVDFVKERGAFMDSRNSTGKIEEWMKDPRVEIEEYMIPDPAAPDGGFQSFNEFFSRTFKSLTKSRPQSMPDKDYVISAPTDCTMNSIPQIIENVNTPVTTKGNESLNIVDLLGGSEYADAFIGGTALSCILMPNTYHHYHSPVSGHVVESKIIKDAMFGVDNFPVWAADGNVGYYGSDFSWFERFQRGYFIVDTGQYGLVALIPVGLNTISSLVFVDKYNNVTAPTQIERGDELGYFLYGGSLFMMIFQKGRYKSDAIKVRLGNQIGIFDTEINLPDSE